MSNSAEILTPQVISALLKGDHSVFVFGFLRYDNGYNWFGLFEPSEIGYCFKYTPPSEQYGGDTFEVCRNPELIYTHEFRPTWHF
jgi:hypothetical protein